MESNRTLLGYRIVTHTGEYVHASLNNNYTFTSTTDPNPIPIADAYKRIGVYLQDHPGAPVPEVRPVHRELTAMERGASELGALLSSLCERHGIVLGLSQDQIDDKIAKELVAFGMQASDIKR